MEIILFIVRRGSDPPQYDGFTLTKNEEQLLQDTIPWVRGVLEGVEDDERAGASRD
jgi:hypothetical protein